MKQVLISGAGSGIGLACAQLFSEKGWHAVLLGRNEKKLQDAQKSLKNTSSILVADLSNVGDFVSLSQQAQAQKLSLTALINNAGIYQPSRFEDESAESWIKHFETNLFGAVRLTHLFWSQLMANKGSVVNVSSTLGLRPIENTGAYSASKAAMNNWTQTLALEAGRQGVRVNAICPGLVDTPIHSFHQSSQKEHQALRDRLDRMQPLQRMGQPREIAEAVYFAACNETASWMTGALLPVDGGISLTTRDP